MLCGASGSNLKRTCGALKIDSVSYRRARPTIGVHRRPQTEGLCDPRERPQSKGYHCSAATDNSRSADSESYRIQIGSLRIGRPGVELRRDCPKENLLTNFHPVIQIT